MRRWSTLFLLVVLASLGVHGCPRRAAGPPPAVAPATAAPAATGPLTAADLATALTADGRAILRDVHFHTAEATLLPESTPALLEVRTLLQANPQLSLEIGVHTDSRGSAAYNQSISAERASALAAWLVAQGVDPARITPVGYGESRPLDCGETPECMARCRRIELVIP